MSKKQAISVVAVLTAGVVGVLLAGRAAEPVMVSAVAVLLALGALSVIVLRVQSASLRELRRLSSSNKRAHDKTSRELSKVAARQVKIEQNLAATRTEVKATNTRNEAHIEKAAGHVDRVRALKVRFEEAERRIIAGTEISRMSMEDSVKKLTSQSTRESREIVLQVESLLQLFGDGGPTRHAPMPPTGSYALDAPALLHLLHLIRTKRPRRILELGSGTSTIWMAYLCRELGIQLTSLDHLEEYAARTMEGLRRHGLEDVVDLRIAPLQPVEIGGETYQWYSTEAMTGLEEIDFLIVDGPPQSTGRRARIPAVPVLWDKLALDATVVLDDTHRAGEVAILESWRSEHDELVQVDAGLTRLGVLTRGSHV